MLCNGALYPRKAGEWIALELHGVERLKMSVSFTENRAGKWGFMAPYILSEFSKRLSSDSVSPFYDIGYQLKP